MAPIAALVEVAVRDVGPIGAGIVRLPDAAGTGAEVEGGLLGGMAGDGEDTPPARRTDAAKLHGVEREGIRD